jgi:dUTP pyrophosphatase
VRLANCVGVIDSDYRGEVQVKLSNDGGDHFTINNDDRIAQAMLVKLPWVELIEVDELSETARGTNGFGSTGS